MINQNIENADDEEKTQSTQSEKAAEQAPVKEKIKIEFPYSDLARAKAPKVFEVAETVANQWVNNEKFENLGLPHPIAEVAAVKALEKAKEVEKKLEEKGVITAAKMGVEIAKLQAQAFLQKIKK